MIIGKKKCPTCGIEGKSWRKNPDVFICPKCSTFYNEFGLVFQGNKNEDIFM